MGIDTLLPLNKTNIMNTNLKNLLLANTIFAICLLSICGVYATDVARVFEFAGHTHVLFSAVFSPDGKQIVTASADQTARIWDVHSGKEVENRENFAASILFGDQGAKVHAIRNPTKELKKLEGHTLFLTSATFSPDGKKIVTSSADQTARIWDADSGMELQKLEGHSLVVSSAVFSPDGKTIATAGYDQTVRIWDVDSGRELQKFEAEYIVSKVAFSPDGKKFVMAGGGHFARIWDIGSGKELQQLKKDTLVKSAVFSPNGKRIATVLDDQTVQIWDAYSGKELHKLIGHSDGVIDAAFSPNGEKLLQRVLIEPLESGMQNRARNCKS